MYDVNYFIQKFEAIPEDKWCIGKFNEGNSSCALGHLGCYVVVGEQDACYVVTEVAKQLNEMVNKFFDYKTCVWVINDGYCADYPQSIPKQRILAALYDIRDKELSEANVIAVKEIVNQVSEPLNV